MRFRPLVLTAAAALSATSAAMGTQKPTACAVSNENEEVVFDCGGELISDVQFASFGTPHGTCANKDAMYRDDDCHFVGTMAALEDRCLGQATCIFSVLASTFGTAPACSGSASGARWLAAVVVCGNTPTERGEAAAPSGIGLIWKLNLLILLAFACYFGLGFLYKSRRHGAQGLEAVPHLETWKELPYLVRDGVIFSVDTIKSKGRASYDPVL
jgi:hypothetical protein